MEASHSMDLGLPPLDALDELEMPLSSLLEDLSGSPVLDLQGPLSLCGSPEPEPQHAGWVKTESLQPPVPQQPLSAVENHATSDADAGHDQGDECTAGQDHGDDCTDGGAEPGPKKRRRVRNSKQQELNRLAQQRYRQRKKEKYSELQGAASELEQAMSKLCVLEEQAEALRSENATFKEQLVNRVAELEQVRGELRSQSAVLKQTQERLEVAEKNAAEQQATVEQLKQRAASQQQQQAVASLPAGIIDPQALSDRLLQVIKTALAEVGSQGGAGSTAAATLASEAVVAQISRTLTSCCRELVYNNSHSALPHSKAPVPKDSAAAIPVSCC